MWVCPPSPATIASLLSQFLWELGGSRPRPSRKAEPCGRPPRGCSDARPLSQIRPLCPSLIYKANSGHGGDEGGRLASSWAAGSSPHCSGDTMWPAISSPAGGLQEAKLQGSSAGSLPHLEPSSGPWFRLLRGHWAGGVSGLALCSQPCPSLALRLWDWSLLPTDPKAPREQGLLILEPMAQIGVSWDAVAPPLSGLWDGRGS